MFTAGRGPTGRAAGAGANRLAGLTIPGLANCHSHAFHRALRGRTQRERGTFWTWREQMYAVAGRLDPGHLLRRWPGRRTGRWSRAGITAVGEFHYLHHQPDGTPYDDPNAMGARARRGRPRGRASGSRCSTPATSPPASAAPPRACRCGSPTATRTPGPTRVDALAARPTTSWSARRSTRSARCRATSCGTVAAGRAPRRAAARAPLRAGRRERRLPRGVRRAPRPQLLAEAGVLGPRTTAVHATHLTDDDVAPARRGRAPTPASAPPPSATSATASARAGALHDAGRPLTLGSDSHAVIDLFEEMRAVELDERLATQRARALDRRRAARRRHRRRPRARSASTTPAGSRSARAPTWSPSTPTTLRTAGTGADEHTAVFAAAAADVVQVDRATARGRLPAGDREPSIGRDARPPRSGGLWHDAAPLITGIGELVTNDPDADDLLGVARRRRARRRGRPGRLGRARRRGARRPTTRVDVGGRAVHPGLRRLATATWSSPATGPRSSRPGWPATPYSAGGIRTTVAATRAATDEQLTANVARLVAEMRRQGTTTVEIKSGYGLTVRDEARSLAIARQFTEETTFLGAHVVPAGARRRPRGVRRPGHRPDAGRPARRTPAGSTCSARRGAFDADQARAVLAAGRGAGPARPAARQPARPRPRRPAGLRARPGRGRPLHLPRPTPTSTRSRDSGTIATLLPGRGVLDPVAVPRRPPAARRRRARSRWPATATPAPATPRSMPLCIALAVREMGMTPAEALHAATAGGAAALGPRRRRRTSASGARGRPRRARRPVVPPPRLPPRRPAGPPDLGARPARLADVSGSGRAPARRWR